ncbi:MAG: hypothetical protein HZA31_13495 [Opitutae bacterium]|nr:hypothetical protein [Opitutae bacterium]
MKLISILATTAGLSLAAFVLGISFDRLALPLFAFTTAAWLVLLSVKAYAPTRAPWQPRLTGTCVENRRAAALPFAA